MTEKELREKLGKIERLYAGAATPGEKDAAADAMARILRRLEEAGRQERPIEYRFILNDDWSRALFVALLRRYSLKPYRRPRQRRTTVLVCVPPGFVDETLWPEFLELEAVLKTYLDHVTSKVIRECIHADESDIDPLNTDIIA